MQKYCLEAGLFKIKIIINFFAVSKGKGYEIEYLQFKFQSLKMFKRLLKIHIYEKIY